IFDGNFYFGSLIDDLRQKLSYRGYVFTLKAPVEVCVARDAQRPKPCGRRSVRKVHAKSLEVEDGIPIDATRPPDAMVQEVLSHLGRVPGNPGPAGLEREHRAPH
ncbi:MAG: hypothetical protein L3J91_04875, partial [Thermoplasmata archaeon]|nr:hypothetical protein [Thermoplasmata archaeon]